MPLDCIIFDLHLPIFLLIRSNSFLIRLMLSCNSILVVFKACNSLVNESFLIVTASNSLLVALLCISHSFMVVLISSIFFNSNSNFNSISLIVPLVTVGVFVSNSLINTSMVHPT
eukprot:NODE_5_length_49639_cov_0.484336.p27 type:complete len:115 gc:universal NODE_5_length_49639_cov_0.484336:10295-10639(+)